MKEGRTNQFEKWKAKMDYLVIARVLCEVGVGQADLDFQELLFSWNYGIWIIVAVINQGNTRYSLQ